MILISLLIALALEFHFKLGSEYRNFSWFNLLRDRVSDFFADKAYFSSWGGIAIILLLPLLTLFIIVNLFDGLMYSVVLWLASIIILFLCLGPKTLENSFQGYFKSIKNEDYEGAFLQLNSITTEEDESADIPEKDELVRSATQKILTESQSRYFGVIVWFILLGPLGALFYRLSHIYYRNCKLKDFDEHFPLMAQLIHWLDWVPARITSLFFLLTGDFVNGFYRNKDYMSDLDADNNELISATGLAALGLKMGLNNPDIDENSLAMDMVHRTVIIYLVVAALIVTTV